MIDVRVLCLGVLSRGDASGYEIRKAFESGPLSLFSDAGFGSIYPALRRLLDDGMIVLVSRGGEGRPDKKVYRVTPQGRNYLLQAINRPPAPDKLRSEFMFTLFFSHLLPARQVDRLLAERIEDLRETIQGVANCDAEHSTPGEKFVHGLGLAIHKAAADYLDAHRHDLASASRAEPKVAE